MADPLLKTTHLALSPLREGDAGDMARLANDFDVARNLTRLPYPYTREDADHFIQNMAHKDGAWRIGRASDDALLGVVSLKPTGPKTAHLGYWLGRAFWGRGYGTQAASALVAYGFKYPNTELNNKPDLHQQPGLNQITSGFFAGNPASGRILEKLGFEQTGRSQHYSLAAKASFAHIDVALSAEKWRTRPAP